MGPFRLRAELEMGLGRHGSLHDRWATMGAVPETACSRSGRIGGGCSASPLSLLAPIQLVKRLVMLGLATGVGVRARPKLGGREENDARDAKKFNQDRVR